MNKESLFIAIDFDGTCVAHRYPYIGKDIGAIPVLKEIVQNGHDLILYTVRVDYFLLEAVAWFKENNIPLVGVWTEKGKLHADWYIDDHGLGMPLIYDKTEPKPYVDWKETRKILIRRKVIKL